MGLRPVLGWHISINTWNVFVSADTLSKIDCSLVVLAVDSFIVRVIYKGFRLTGHSLFHSFSCSSAIMFSGQALRYVYSFDGGVVCTMLSTHFIWWRGVVLRLICVKLRRLLCPLPQLIWCPIVVVSGDSSLEVDWLVSFIQWVSLTQDVLFNNLHFRVLLYQSVRWRQI